MFNVFITARVDGIHQPFCSHLDRAFKLVTFNVSLLDVMLCLHTKLISIRLLLVGAGLLGEVHTVL